MHHVQAIATTMSVSQYRRKSREGLRDFLRNLFAPFYNPPTNVFSILGRYEGPALLLEYVENGALLDLVLKAQERRITLPNRLLWRWYFCRMIPSLSVPVTDCPVYAVLIKCSIEGYMWDNLSAENTPKGSTNIRGTS